MKTFTSLFLMSCIVLLANTTQAQDTPSGFHVGATILGGAGGAALGLGISLGLTQASLFPGSCPADAACSIERALVEGYDIPTTAFVMSFTLGGSALTALGTYGAGRLAGGQGRYDYTLLGATLGTGVGFGIFSAVAQADLSDSAYLAAGMLLPVMQLVGSLLAYHLSHAAAGQDLQMGPTVSVDADGAVLGLSGLF